MKKAIAAAFLAAMMCVGVGVSAQTKASSASNTPAKVKTVKKHRAKRHTSTNRSRKAATSNPAKK